jgi:hypothetical protein
MFKFKSCSRKYNRLCSVSSRRVDVMRSPGPTVSSFQTIIISNSLFRVNPIIVFHSGSARHSIFLVPIMYKVKNSDPKIFHERSEILIILFSFDLHG